MVAHEILVSAQGPLVLGLGQRGLGLRVGGQGLTNIKVIRAIVTQYIIYVEPKIKIFVNLKFKLKEEFLIKYCVYTKKVFYTQHHSLLKYTFCGHTV